ncbi:unnamed protein product [Brassica oleracea]
MKRKLWWTSFLTPRPFPEELKNSRAPDIAVKYYTGSDLYLFVALFCPHMNSKHPVLPTLEGQELIRCVCEHKR